MTRRSETLIRCDADGCDNTAKVVAAGPASTVSQLVRLGWRIGRKRDLCPTHARRGGVTR